MSRRQEDDLKRNNILNVGLNIWKWRTRHFVKMDKNIRGILKSRICQVKSKLPTIYSHVFSKPNVKELQRLSSLSKDEILQNHVSVWNTFNAPSQWHEWIWVTVYVSNYKTSTKISTDIQICILLFLEAYRLL